MTDAALVPAFTAEPPSQALRFTGIQLLTGNADAWRAKRQMIAGATTSLDLCYFILEHDATTAVLLEDLVAAAKRGVRVRLLLDYFMTFKQSDVLRVLATVPNIQVRRYRPPTAAWRKALRELGINELKFLEGLATMDMKLMAAAFSDTKALSPAFGDILGRLEAGPGESRFSVALRMRNALVDELKAEIGRLQSRLQGTAGEDGVGGGLLGRLFDVGQQLLNFPSLIRWLDDVLDGLDLFLHRTHHKLMLADDTSFIMGGRNLADAYHLDAMAAPARPFIDTDVLVTDRQGAGEHAAAFKALWDGGLSVDVLQADTLDVRPAVTMQVITDMAATLDRAGVIVAARATAVTPLPDAEGYVVNNGPTDVGDEQITHAYVERIRAVTALGHGRIDLVSAYVCLVERLQGSASLARLRQCLLDAAEAGVEVNLYTNSITTTDLAVINAVAYLGLARMIDGGVNIFELEDGQGSLHTKAAAIGADWLLVGSYNLDPRSELYDTNNLLALHDQSGEATARFRATRIDAYKWRQLTVADAAKLTVTHGMQAAKLALVARVL